MAINSAILSLITEELGSMARRRVTEIARELDGSSIPYDDWMVLYSDLNHLEHAVCGGPRLVDPQPVQAVQKDQPQREVAMATIADPRPEVSTSDLIKEAIQETETLLRTEIELAKDEVRREVTQAKSAAIAGGVAAVLAILAMALLLMALVGAITARPVGPLAGGVILLVGAGIAGLVGYKVFPKKPLAETQREIKTDVRMLKESLA